jgi:amphiphysin
MIDYDSARAKVKKLVEKPADDSTKLPRAQAEHDEARDIFTLMNDQLIAELPLLVDLRIRASFSTSRVSCSNTARSDIQPTSTRLSRR